MEGLNNQGQTPGKVEKTFTQEEVNAIVGKRLAEQKASGSKELDDREKALDQREMELKAREILSSQGLPKELADILKYSDESSLNAAIDMIRNVRDKNNGFRVIENRLPDGASHETNRDRIKEAFHLQK